MQKLLFVYLGTAYGKKLKNPPTFVRYIFFSNFGIPLLVPYIKDFGRITQF